MGTAAGTTQAVQQASTNRGLHHSGGSRQPRRCAVLLHSGGACDAWRACCVIHLLVDVQLARPLAHGGAVLEAAQRRGQQ